MMVTVPVEIWQRVLQYVPLQQRLESCALVCSTCHAAAVAATDRIYTSFGQLLETDRESFLAYLQHHGSYLTSITVNGSVVLRELPPCQHLQQLCLTDCEVELGPHEGGLGVLGSVAGIACLEIERCVIHGMDAFAALSVLVNLQHLCVVEEDEGDPPQLDGMALSSVQNLTHLKLSWVKVTAEDLCHISSLSRLYALELYGDARLTSDAFPAGFTLPPSLRHLTFKEVLESSFLATATQLTYLDLSGAYIEEEGAGQGEDNSGACLLEALATLQHLDTLRLGWLDVNWPPASLAYQAIVASSGLRSLPIDPGSGNSPPDGALAYVFPLEPPQHLVRTGLEELTVQPKRPWTPVCSVALQVSAHHYSS